MGITYGDHLIDSGHNDITPEQEREIEAREECARTEVRHFKNLAGKDRTMLMKPGRFPDYR